MWKMFLNSVNDNDNNVVRIVVAALVPLVLFFWYNSNNNNKKKKIPRCLPCGWLETIKKVTSSDGIWFLASWAKQIGYVYQIPIPHPHYVFCVGDPILARDILQDPGTTKPRAFYGPVDDATGASSIFTANGERWRHARKAVAPAFTSSHIKRMNQVCKDKLEEWIQQRLKVFCASGQSFDATDEMILLTLSIISEAAFEYDMKQDEAALFVQELDLSIREFLLRRGSNPLRGTWLGYLWDRKVIQRAHLASRNGQGIAKNILQSYRNNNKKQNHSTSFAKGTVIEYIVMNPQYQNDAERIADILVFLVGGHDTTAYTIAWTLLELARHPNEMEHVRNELSNLTSEEERLKCPALDHVIRESMRLHPVAANILREVHRDFHVDDETVIPKGSVVFLMNILIHRHPQYFDQPDQFMPSRWKDNNNNSNNNNNTVFAAFAPFALGARNCVGQALAQAELHTVLARFIMDYDFEVEDPGKAECTLTLKPSGLKLKARTKQ